jgi:voltage-dependent potassium channel beta subunit
MAESTMTYRRLGRCGMHVSTFGLGGWMTFGHQIKEQEVAEQLIRSAFEDGINFFDIADVYAIGKSEEVMGRILGGFPRNEIVVSSKLFWPMSKEPNDRGLSRKHINESIERSLGRVGTDYLDIYFCHRFDTETPLDETVRAMDDLIRAGKILHWGTSEWTGQQLNDACRLCDQLGCHRPQVEQPEYSLLTRRKVERDVAAVAQAWGIGMVTWSPLGMGLLTGKFDDGMVEGTRLADEEWLREGRFTESNINRIRQFKTIADEVGCSRTQLALAWVAAQGGVSSVILGCRTLEQYAENMAARNIEVTEELARKLDLLFQVRPAL